MLIFYGTLKRDRGARANRRPRAGNHGKSTEAGNGEDPLDPEPSS